MRRTNACPICLYPGQGADACKNKENPDYVCGIQGCKSYHHPSLHGGKDPAMVKVSAVLGKFQQVCKQMNADLTVALVALQQKELELEKNSLMAANAEFVEEVEKGYVP